MTKSKDIEIRHSLEEDGPYLAKWLEEPGILRWFPMINEREIEDAVKIWIGYTKIKSNLTAVYNGTPCGMAILYIQPFQKLAHTCLLAIIVDKDLRGKGIGALLLDELTKLAKKQFHIETLHLEVYEENPAKRLYERAGFTEFGYMAHFLKEEGRYRGKCFMQKKL